MSLISTLRKTLANGYVAALLGTLPALAQARPMGFKDSWVAMGDLGPNWQEAWVNYALTPRDAVGMGALGMRSDDKRLRRTFEEITYTRLVQRWNTRDSQANLGFVGGIGSVQGNTFSGSRLA